MLAKFKCWYYWLGIDQISFSGVWSSGDGSVEMGVWSKMNPQVFLVQLFSILIFRGFQIFFPSLHFLMEQRSPVLIKHCYYMSVRKLNWIFHGELQWILLFETIANIRCFNPLNTNMNTNLKYYCKQALSKKLKLIREAMNFFIKLLLGPEVFSSMIPWHYEIIFEKFVKPSGHHLLYT